MDVESAVEIDILREDTTVETLVSFASALEWGRLTPDAIHEAKRRVIDLFAIALAGYTEDPSAIARSIAPGRVRPGATVFGTRHRSTPPTRGICERDDDLLPGFHGYLSFEGILAPQRHHRQSSPRARAQAQMALASFSASFSLMEVDAPVGDVANVRERGWDHVVFGAIASALASAKVLDLTVEQMVRLWPWLRSLIQPCDRRGSEKCPCGRPSHQPMRPGTDYLLRV